VRHKLLSLTAARLRGSMGISELAQRLEALEERVESLPDRIAERGPGPVYLGDHTALVKTRWGGMLLIDTRESVLGPALMLYGLWEIDITRWFEETLEPGKVFVDVGANIGYYSLLASRLVGDAGKVVAIEAHPRMAELLHRNMIINAQYNVSTWHKAAWSRSEKLTFHARRHFGANSSAGSLGDRDLEKLDDQEEIVEVDAVALDDLLSDLPRVDLIKIDVEGAELQVVTGLADTLAGNPDIKVIFEWSPGQLEMVGNKPEALVELMEQHGFVLRLMERGLEALSGAELLTVHYGNVVASRL
jgi:FkbM family methyltransferase